VKFLVTGGAGYIGSHVAAALIHRKDEVVTFDSLETGHARAISGDFVQGTLLSPDDLERAMQKGPFDAVLHFAAYSLVPESMKDPLKYYTNNNIGGINLLNAMVKHNVPSIVFSSTAAVYGNPEYTPIDEHHPRLPINPYGHSKLIFENILRDLTDHGLIRSVILRYFNAAGASSDGLLGEDHQFETHLIPLVIQAAMGTRAHVAIYGTDYETEDGTCVRDYIHVEDLADAHLLALSRLADGKSGVYNLGNGEGDSVKAVIEAVKKVSNQSFEVRCEPRRPGDPPVLVASSDKARKELGWEPRYPAIEDIVATAWQWHTNNKEGFSE